MPIHITCDKCNARFNAPDSAAGKSGKCPKCAAPLKVPAAPLGFQADKSPAELAKPAVKAAKTSAIATFGAARAIVQKGAAAIRDRQAVEGELVAAPPAPVIEATIVSRPATPPPTPAPIEARACPFCAEPIQAVAKKCKHCGEILDPVLRAAEEAKRLSSAGAHAGNNSAPVHVHVNQSVAHAVNHSVNQAVGVVPVRQGSRLVAALLSLMLPGLGQIYRGRLVSGVCWFIFTAIGYAAFFIPGMMLHIACVLAALFG